MKANAGDEIIVDSMHTGEPPREGEILEVRERDGVVSFLVRWDDNGHESVFIPGSTSHVVRVKHTGPAKAHQRPGVPSSP